MRSATLPLSFPLFLCDFLTLTAGKFCKKKKQSKTSKHKHKNAKSLKPQDEGRESLQNYSLYHFWCFCILLYLPDPPIIFSSFEQKD